MRLSSKRYYVSEDRSGDIVYLDVYPQPCDWMVICESCSVNDTVLEWADIVEEQIIKHAGDKINHGRKNGDVISDTLEITGLPFTLHLKYIFYMFDDMTDYWKNNTIKYDSYVDTEKWKDNDFSIELVSPVIGNRLSAFYFLDGVTHEMEHIFSIIKRGKYFREEEDTDDESLTEYYYKKASKFIQNPRMKSEGRMAAMCYYLCEWYERHAFTHGLYNSLSALRKSSYDPEEIYNKFKETPQYKHLEMMKELINNYDSYLLDLNAFFVIPNVVDSKVGNLGYYVYQFFKPRLEKSYKRYSEACGKVLCRILDQKNLKMVDMRLNKFDKSYHWQE